MASPASRAARSKGLAGATVATESPGRRACGLRKLENGGIGASFARTACGLPAGSLVRQGFQVTQQRRTPAIELIETLRGIAQGDDVLHRLLVQTAIGVACRQPLTGGGGVARRQV